MSHKTINIDKKLAKKKLINQATKGLILGKKGQDFIKNNPQHSRIRHEVDKYKVELDHWIDITYSTLGEIFESTKIARDFKKHKATKKEYVSSSWQPDIKYYNEYELLPKIGYLEIIIENLDDFDETLPSNKSNASDIKELKKPITDDKSKIKTINIDNFDFSKITFPQLFNILSIPQIIKIITTLFGLLAFAFWFGYYVHSFNTNKEVITKIDKLTEDFNELKISNDSLLNSILIENIE